MILPIADPLRQHLESLPASDNPNAPLHPRAARIVEQQGRTGALSNHLADLLAIGGLREKKDHQGHGRTRSHTRAANPFSFHSLRRTTTTLLAEAGIPSAVTQALIGHDSDAMHQFSVSVGREALNQAAATLPEVL